ncbi:MAG: general secretion pathway protein GspK [Xanthomonadales bacterium]|nr:general secretion pathway protein GspK [Gammaproteobacteria bacterium]MBT8075720.1 general secretion pathway protein GspK [Gammaproteobacteria bacterium]NNK03793.1 general secretion pathway protein GspK [Xanthomonadales bacterium]NNK97925.1 general secretion pathway protein GspK [Xanthomonadales bacterium]
MSGVKGISSQRGIALVLVLWVLLLLTIITGSFALMARMDRLEANALLSGTQARLSAEAAINLAVLALRDPDDLTRMRADGRVYQQELDGVLVEVSAIDERGKLDINATEELTLATLFTGHGLELEDAEMLAAAILDWRDEDELERVNGAELDAYIAAGLEVGPANRPFMMTEELLQVIGMPFELYRQLEPGITVFSRVGEPNPAFAPVEALMALPDITHEEAMNFVDERNSQEPGDSLGTELPNGVVVMEQGRGVTYSIQARATMPNGVWEQLQATIRLGGTASGSPYRVLRWREGFQY